MTTARPTLLVRSALIAALAGFLFGFDTVVISGAEQRIQALWMPETRGLALEQLESRVAG